MSGGWLGSIGGRIAKGFKCLLKEGLAPQELARTICLGIAVGTMPILWGTTLICALLAAKFRLNQALMQGFNYLLYPLQISLLFPFYRLSQILFPWGPSISSEFLQQALHGRVSSTIAIFGWATLKALGAWLLIVPPLLLILYPIFVALLRRRVLRARLASTGPFGPPVPLDPAPTDISP